ncbi:hypothetical protein [Nonomuraea turcica]|nr:hypothetical protein [Nonomuraea sp. G32]MDP4510331.1 hypothetical protein [Nonomuraea sp. G32]
MSITIAWEITMTITPAEQRWRHIELVLDRYSSMLQARDGQGVAP